MNGHTQAPRHIPNAITGAAVPALAALAAAATLLAGPSAHAHGGADERFKVGVTANQVKIETCLPMAEIAHIADVDQNGTVTRAELRQTHDALSAWIDARLTVHDQTGTQLDIGFSDHTGIIDDHHDLATFSHIRIRRRYVLSEGQIPHAVNTALFAQRQTPVDTLLIANRMVQRHQITVENVGEIHLSLSPENRDLG